LIVNCQQFTITFILCQALLGWYSSTNYNHNFSFELSAKIAMGRIPDSWNRSRKDPKIRIAARNSSPEYSFKDPNCLDRIGFGATRPGMLIQLWIVYFF